MTGSFHIKAAQYLSGELNTSEQEQFAEHLKHDPSLKKEINTIAQYWKKMEDNNSSRFNSDQAWSKLENRLEENDAVKQRKMIKRPVMGIAAAIILAFGLLALMIAYFLPGHDQIRYVADSRMEITLPDNSTVILKEGSQLTLAEHFDKKTRTTNLKGQAWFDIAPNANKPFIIEAARSKIQVLGTAFSVDSRPNRADLIVVKEGKVQVTHKYSNSNILLTANESVEASDNQLTTIENPNPNYLSWALKDFYLSNTRLDQVAAMLEEAFNKKVTFSDSSIGQLRISATFENQNLEEIIDIICETHDLKYSSNTNEVIVNRRN